ncbi:MAG: MBL fold metallo-hydrolase, partial [Gemmatimonadetes bacterium]|nr:MBL fold metallo-hydrolase [Gemmatimonadota bacterium]
HADHTGGVAAVRRAFDAVFAAPEGDVELLERPDAWMTAMLPDFAPPPAADLVLREGDVLELGGMELRVVGTPGHTPGGVSFVLGHIVFAGDTLFRGSIGRTDLPGGDFEQELASIREVLFPLGDEVRVLPGHGPATTIGEERRTNPFLAGRWYP